MKRRFVSWFAAVVLATAAFSMATGCALFGGSDDDEASVTGDTEFSEGGLGGSGSLSGDESGAFEVSELQTIYFDFDRAVIRDDQKPMMRSNASAVEQHQDWRIIVVEGHTDAFGSDAQNLSLSQARADSVVQYLLTNTPISPANLSAMGFGESKPVANNETPDGRTRNRRIDVVIYPSW